MPDEPKGKNEIKEPNIKPGEPVKPVGDQGRQDQVAAKAGAEGLFDDTAAVQARHDQLWAEIENNPFKIARDLSNLENARDAQAYINQMRYKYLKGGIGNNNLINTARRPEPGAPEWISNEAEAMLEKIRIADSKYYDQMMREWEKSKNKEKEDFDFLKRRAEKKILSVLTDLFDYNSVEDVLPGFVSRNLDEDSILININPETTTIADFKKKLAEHLLSFDTDEFREWKNEYDKLSDQIASDRIPAREEGEDIEIWRERVKSTKIVRKNRAIELQNSIHKTEREMNYIKDFIRLLETYILDDDYTIEEYTKKVQFGIDNYNETMKHRQEEEAEMRAYRAKVDAKKNKGETG